MPPRSSEPKGWAAKEAMPPGPIPRLAGSALLCLCPRYARSRPHNQARDWLYPENASNVGPLGHDFGLDKPRIHFSRHLSRQPSIRLCLIGTCPTSNARVIRVSPGHRLTQDAYAAMNPNQTQTYRPIRTRRRPSRQTRGRARQATAATAHLRAPQAKRSPARAGLLGERGLWG